jgi:putative DNA primase/helicase
MPGNLFLKGNRDFRPSIANLLTIFREDPAWKGVICFNELESSVSVTRRPPTRPRDLEGVKSDFVGAWKDEFTTAAIAWLEATYSIHASVEPIGQAILAVARDNPIHPVREYLKSLAWDGVPRLEHFAATYLGVTESGETASYSASVGKILLLSAVARAMEPGCKVDTIVVLEGSQGRGKSTALRVLAGDAYFTDSEIDFGNKDAYQSIAGKWIVELAEVDKHRGRDASQVKAFISSQSDRYRPSYGRLASDHKRGCVLVGTTNADNYLTDATGNRRWLPLRVGVVDVERLKRDRDQLWAEAVNAYERGDKWWPTGELVSLAADAVETRHQGDPWDEPIADYLAAPRAPKAVTVAEILWRALALPPDRQTRSLTMRVSDILKRLGWEKGQQTVDGKRAMYWQASAPELPQVSKAPPFGI